MKTEFKRRDFLATCLKAGITCCALMAGTSLEGQEGNKKVERPNPKALNYCGYKCSNDCPLYKGTIENNVELKKKVYEDSKWKEKYGIEFDPEKVFCWGCKISDKPMAVSVKACTVRACVLEKKLDCCIQCESLPDCKKELWLNYPKFKEKVIEMQVRYKQA